MPPPAGSPLSHIAPPDFTDTPSMPRATRNAVIGIWICAIFASLVAIMGWVSTFIGPMTQSWIFMPGGIWAAVLSTIVAVTLKAIAMGLKRGSGWARRLGSDFCWIAIAALVTGAVIETHWAIALAGLCPITLLLFLLSKATRRWCDISDNQPLPPELIRDSPSTAEPQFSDEREAIPAPAQP